MGVSRVVLLTDLLLSAASGPDSLSVFGEVPHSRHLSADLQSLSSLQISFSSGGGAPIFWDAYILEYSLTVPAEAVAVAVVAQLGMEHGDVDLTLFRPEDDHREVLLPGVPSLYVDVPTEEATVLVLQVRSGRAAANYSVSVVRSSITADFQLGYSEATRDVMPQSTLTGLTVFDSFGLPVRTTPAAFTPRQSQYLLSPDMTTAWVQVVASGNDPEARLALRADGGRWEPLEPGRGSRGLAVPERGWLLLEVRVESPAAAAQGRPALVYEALLARGPRCHGRCSSCTGPGEGACRACRPPLTLSQDVCGASGCPVGDFYDWRASRCRPCDASCAQCAGPGRGACTFCPALRFLSPTAARWAARAGACVAECPAGTFAHPPSRRCRRPPTAPIKAFYMSFLFRLPFAGSKDDARLLESIHNTTCFVLGVSLSDVRMHEVKDKGEMLQVMLEIVSPFLSRSEANRILIDSWFGAFEVPVDAVSSLTWDEVHPPAPPAPVLPFLALWIWGFITSAAAALVVCFLSYCFYFRRLKNIKKKYSTRHGIDVRFIDRVVNQSPPWLITRFIAFDSGSKQHQAELKDG